MELDIAVAEAKEYASRDQEKITRCAQMGVALYSALERAAKALDDEQRLGGIKPSSYLLLEELRSAGLLGDVWEIKFSAGAWLVNRNGCWKATTDCKETAEAVLEAMKKQA